jgi:hypothetical protein
MCSYGTDWFVVTVDVVTAIDTSVPRLTLSRQSD